MTNTKSTSLKKSRVSMPHPIADISPISIGLTIVNILDPSLLPDTRSALEKMVRDPKPGHPIFLEEVESITSIYCGNRRRLEHAKVMAAVSLPQKSNIQHNHRLIESRHGVNWGSDEGVCVLTPIVRKSQGLVTLEQELSGPVTPAFVDGMLRIRQTSKIARNRVMLFLVNTDPVEKTQLDGFCDEYFEIAPCEPDIDCYIAFSIDCVALRNLNRLGIGKSMCNAKLYDGLIHRTYAPFLSEKFVTRLVWYMRGNGMSYTEIGKLIKADKSNAFRCLKGLPPPMPITKPKDWLKRSLEWIGLDTDFDSNGYWDTSGDDVPDSDEEESSDEN